MAFSGSGYGFRGYSGGSNVGNDENNEINNDNKIIHDENDDNDDDIHADDREKKRMKKSQGSSSSSSTGTGVASRGTGIMNFVGELFWRKEPQQQQHQQHEIEESDAEHDSDNNDEENDEENEEAAGEESNIPQAHEKETIYLDDDDDDDDDNPEERDHNEAEVEIVRNEHQEETHDENLTQLTPSEYHHTQDDSSVQHTDHGIDGEDTETISNAPSDYDRQYDAGISRGGDAEGVFYKGQLVHQMSYRDLGKHLKALGLRAAGKKSYLIQSLERAVKHGLEASDDLLSQNFSQTQTQSQSQSSNVEIKTPKRKRNLVESPQSTRTPRSSRRIQDLQAGTVKLPTRLASSRKTINSQKDSYLTAPRGSSPPSHHYLPPHRTNTKTRRRSTRKKTSAASDHEHENEHEHEIGHENDHENEHDTELKHHDEHALTDADHHHNQDHDHDQDHGFSQNTEGLEIDDDHPTQNSTLVADSDSELEGYYSPVEYNPREHAPVTHPRSLPQQVQRTVTPEPTVSNTHFESVNKYDYEDLTDSISIVETASIAATNGSALSPVNSYPSENGPHSTMQSDHLPPPRRYAQYIMGNRMNENDRTSSTDGQQHTRSQHIDDELSSIARYPEPHSSFSPPETNSHHSRGPLTTSNSSTAVDDVMGAMGNRFVAMLRGEGPQLSDAEYAFFKTLLESKRPPGSAPIAPLPQIQPQIQLQEKEQEQEQEKRPPPTSFILPQSIALPVSLPVATKEPIAESRKGHAVDTCVQTEENEDYTRRKRAFSETENSPQLLLTRQEDKMVVKEQEEKEEREREREGELLQSSKRRRELSPTTTPSYPPFLFSGFQSDSASVTTSTSSSSHAATAVPPDREWMAPRRHSLHSSSPYLSNSPYSSTPRSVLDSFSRPILNSSPVAIPHGAPPPPSQLSLPVSLQVQHQSLSQSNQTAAISSVQRRLMRRRTTFNTNAEDSAVSHRSSANGVVAKRILETLGEITATLDEQRKKPLITTQPSEDSNVAPQSKVRFHEATPQPKPLSQTGLSVKDRIATPKSSNILSTPSSSSLPSSSLHSNSLSTPQNFGRDSLEATEPLWSRERGRTSGHSLSPAHSGVASVSSSSRTTPVDLPTHEQEEFTFNAPKDIEGLEDDLSTNFTSSSNKNVRFVFSPPAKKVTKKYPPTPGGAKLKQVETSKLNSQPPSNVASKTTENNNSNGLPAFLVNRPNSIKCPSCMVFNDKSAPRCVACETKLTSNDSVAPNKPLPNNLINRANSIKCPTCMVFNDKTAERCVACEGKLPKTDLANPQSAPAAATTADANKPSSSGFTFSSSASSASGITFGSTITSSTSKVSSDSTVNKTPAISFGSTQPKPSSSISFGNTAISTSKDNNNTTTAPATKPASGFSFGSTPAAPPPSTAPAAAGGGAASSTGLSFGSKTAPALSSTTPSAPSAPSSTFTSSTTPSTPASTGFSFGSSATKAGTSTSQVGFSATGIAPLPSSATSGIVFGAKSDQKASEPSEKESTSKSTTFTTTSTTTTTMPLTTFSTAGKSFTGFGNSSTSLAAKVNEKNDAETSKVIGSKPFQLLQSTSSSAPASSASASTTPQLNTFGSVPPQITKIQNDGDGDEDRGKKRQARGESEQSSIDSSQTKPSFSFGGSAIAKAVDSKPSQLPFSTSSTSSTTPSTNPFSGTSKFGSNPVSSLPFGQSNSAATSTAITDPSKNTSAKPPFGLSTPAPFSSTPSSAPFGGVAASKFGTVTPSSQPFGKSNLNTSTFGSDQNTFNRANSVATPPPPPPYGSESPGTMDTGYSGDTNSIPSGTLPPPSTSTFTSGPSSFGFGGTVPKPAFGNSLPTSTFGGIAPSTPSQLPSTTQPFGSFGKPSTFGSSGGAGTGGASNGLGFAAPQPFGSSIATPFGATPGGVTPFGMSGGNPTFGAAPVTPAFGSSSTLGTSQLFNSGGGGGGGDGATMFNLGAPEKNNQAGQKGRRKVKPTWKPSN